MDQSTVPAKKATLRLGNRERGRLQAVLVTIIIIMLWFGVFQPWIGSLIENRDFQTCQVNAHKIARAMTMYQGDWDDAFPPGPVWTTATLGNMAATSGTGFDLNKYLKCPRDKTSGASSYVYNDILAGINPTMRFELEPEKEAKRLKVRNPRTFPLIFEKHGSALNAHTTLNNWDETAAQMSFPHALPDPTGILITGGGNPTRRNRKQIEELAGKRF